MAGYASFDEYWSAFVLEHGQRASRRRRLLALGKSLAHAALGVLSPRLAALASLEPLKLRWAAAATLLSVGKSLAGTMDQEIARAGSIETSGWPSHTLPEEPRTQAPAPVTEPPSEPDTEPPSEPDTEPPSAAAIGMPAVHEHARPDWAVWM